MTIPQPASIPPSLILTGIVRVPFSTGTEPDAAGDIRIIPTRPDNDEPFYEVYDGTIWQRLEYYMTQRQGHDPGAESHYGLLKNARTAAPCYHLMASYIGTLVGTEVFYEDHFDAYILASVQSEMEISFMDAFDGIVRWALKK